MAEKHLQKNTSLGDKVKLIDSAEKNTSVGTRKLAKTFKCGRTQVQALLKAKESITTNFKTNALVPRHWRCHIWVVLSGSRVTCTSVRPYATVRSTIASKGARKRQLQGVQQLVAKLHTEAQHHTACSERGGMWCVKRRSRPEWNDFQLLCKGMLQRIHGMRMRRTLAVARSSAKGGGKQSSESSWIL